jgi:hypothetical protein
MKYKMPWLFLPYAAFLVGCTTPMFTMPPGPQDYRVGFHDGCDDGYASAGSPFYEHTETAQPLYMGEPYVAGWQAGFEHCKSHYQRMQRVVSTVLGPP